MTFGDGKLITITGIDGAGKSTLAKNVCDELRDQGFSATYVYGRFLPVLSYPVMELGRRTVLANSDLDEDYVDHQEKKTNLFSSGGLRRLYELLVMSDYAPQLLLRVVRPLLTHEYVICDRYFYDTLLTDLGGDVIREPNAAITRYKYYEKFIPSPKIEFYIDVPPDVAFARKSDVPQIEYLEDRKRFYDEFAAERNFTKLDGTQSPETLCAIVTEEILAGSWPSE